MNKSLLHKPTGMKESQRRGKYLQSLFEQKVLGLSKTYVTHDNTRSFDDTVQTGSMTSGENQQTMQVTKLPGHGASWVPEAARVTMSSVRFGNVRNPLKPADLDYPTDWKSARAVRQYQNGQGHFNKQKFSESRSRQLSDKRRSPDDAGQLSGGLGVQFTKRQGAPFYSELS